MTGGQARLAHLLPGFVLGGQPGAITSSLSDWKGKIGVDQSSKGDKIHDAISSLSPSPLG
jgi:hypothetical protein